MATGGEKRAQGAVAETLRTVGLHTGRVRAKEQQEVAPLELFYDLVFVFAITRVALEQVAGTRRWARGAP